MALTGATSGQSAFASYSTTPTAPEPGQLTSAYARCITVANGFSRLPHDDLFAGNEDHRKPAVGYVRGLFTLVIVKAPTAFRNRHRDLLEQSRAPDHQRRRRCPRTNGAPWHHSQDGVGSGNFGGQMWVGAAGNGVTGVRIHLNNHTTVTAAVGAGYFAAWWPSQTNIADQIGQPRRPVKRADSPRNTPGTDSLGGTLGFWSPPRLSWL